MIDLHFVDKTGETTDIRNKYEAFVVHHLLKLPKEKLLIIRREMINTGRKKIWQKGHQSYLCTPQKGSLAQLVQSIPITIGRVGVNEKKLLGV
jgi:hypothetical protein